MVLDEDRPIAEVGRAIGVNPGTLGNWVAAEKVERGERATRSASTSGAVCAWRQGIVAQWTRPAWRSRRSPRRALTVLAGPPWFGPPVV